MSTEAAPTITDFLLARIAEDEALARDAAAVRDDGTGRGWVDGPAAQSGKWWVYWTGEKFCHRETANHIARHDPARVLAECAAKRAIIEAEHWEPKPRPSDSELHFRSSHPSYEYATTEGPRKQWDDADEPPEGEGWERNVDNGYGQGWARLDYTEESYWRRLKPEPERKEWKQYIPPTLRILAAVYADHPDYRQEWALDGSR